MSWTTIQPSSYDFDLMELDNLQNHVEYVRNADVCQKEPHELVTTDLINWNTVEYNRATFVRRLQKSPYATIWDYIEPPLGTYRWERGPLGNLDAGLGRLQEIPLEGLIPYRSNKFQWDFKEQTKIERYRAIYTKGAIIASGNPTPTLSKYIDPIKVYKDANGRVVIFDGYKRFMAAQAEGIKTLKAWVFETTNDALLNITQYRELATEKGLTVSEDDVGHSAPTYAPTLGYQSLRKIFYPAIGDQLDAITKYLVHEDTKDLKVLQERIAAVKKRFPK